MLEEVEELEPVVEQQEPEPIVVQEEEVHVPSDKAPSAHGSQERDPSVFSGSNNGEEMMGSIGGGSEGSGMMQAQDD